MKKTLVLLISLLSISCVAGFAGCKDNGTDSNKSNGNVQSKIVAVEDEDDKCPDCEERGMPKVQFDFKNGRPACIGDREGSEPSHGRPHHPPKRPTPVPPDDGRQDKNEN